MNKMQEVENKLNEAIIEICKLPVELGEKANDSVCEALILVKNIDYKPILPTVIKQLDYWIESSELIAEMLRMSGANEAAQIHTNYAQAYWNVKQFIEVNGG